eukprot:CAMPEP_0206015390 /NCGR_PEP_ID=MMETSP1464-20131121/20187_1 /ASSEMBLY_ACC=CAM_ASM_001124 /TAXON_ID=119497 /ORGANISM="Exanthemachrysis gayraliae, Strain RCC1523" /LENGTH=341 /DNA_ID=CAMNT_0053389185 /DNA_START=238 /DNA_END=1261 /DNA_ORIENTATION=+
MTRDSSMVRRSATARTVAGEDRELWTPVIRLASSTSESLASTGCSRRLLQSGALARVGCATAKEVSRLVNLGRKALVGSLHANEGLLTVGVGGLVRVHTQGELVVLRLDDRRLVDDPGSSRPGQLSAQWPCVRISWMSSAVGMSMSNVTTSSLEPEAYGAPSGGVAILPASHSMRSSSALSCGSLRSPSCTHCLPMHLRHAPRPLGLVADTGAGCESAAKETLLHLVHVALPPRVGERLERPQRAGHWVAAVTHVLHLLAAQGLEVVLDVAITYVSFVVIATPPSQVGYESNGISLPSSDGTSSLRVSIAFLGRGPVTHRAETCLGRGAARACRPRWQTRG